MLSMTRPRLFRALPALLVASLGYGCGSPTLDRGWEAVVDTVGDTVIVRTLAGSVWSDTATLVPELSIGVLEGAEEEMFGEVGAIAASPDGEIYVLDEHVQQIRRFGPDGTFLGSIGREGGGPGELRQAEAMALTPDGRLLVRDPGNARISVFARDGASLTSWRLPSGGNFHTSSPLFVDTAGNTYTPILLAVDVDVTEWKMGLARFGPDGTHTDTLPAPTWSEFKPLQLVARREQSTSTTNVPFGPRTASTFSPLGYFVGGLSTDYRIDLYRPGARVLRIERMWTPVRVLDEEKAEQEHRIIENFKREFGSWHWNGPPIPDTKPPFRDVIVGQDGRIWVQLSQPGYPYRSEAEAQEEERISNRPQLRYREHAVFDVFEPDGTYLGAVRAPDEFRTSPEPVLRGDYVWVVTRDDLDVPRVVRYRIAIPQTP